MKRLGVVRESMLSNPALVEAPLGKARTRGFTLPGADFAYGVPIDWTADGGVIEAVSHWKVQPRQDEWEPCPNFIALNRDAVKCGLVTAKEMSQYRAQRGWAAAPRRPEGGATRCPPPPPPDITFGLATNRDPCLMAGILSNEYGRRWVDKQQQHMRSCKTEMKPLRFGETRTSLLRKSTTLPTIDKPFKLSQFSQVPPALDTFRDPQTGPCTSWTQQSSLVLKRDQLVEPEGQC